MTDHERLVIALLSETDDTGGAVAALALMGRLNRLRLSRRGLDPHWEGLNSHVCPPDASALLAEYASRRS